MMPAVALEVPESNERRNHERDPQRSLDPYRTDIGARRLIAVEVEEVANTALFLLSPLSSGITGEIIYVDCGYRIMGA